MTNQPVKAVCPGSFDPITNGHIDIIERAASLFPEVVVGVLENPSKRPLFSLEERVKLIEAAVQHLQNVKVLCFSGLLVDFVSKLHGGVIIKGLRAISDFEIEFQMALSNKKMAPGIETIFLMTKNEYSFLSSSMVREIASFGGDIQDLVPTNVGLALRKKFVDIGVK